MPNAKRSIIQLVSIAIMSLGFAQFSVAGVIGSGDLISAEQRVERISRIEALVARADVAEQLQRFGVTAAVVSTRVQNLTDSELVELEQSIDGQIAGADSAVAVIGVVFLVLMILELVGVTDVFKSF